ncbi:hypothetical protein E2C01_045765 [Portunus trituberculatus]|uniref:Uncharacterized protein n=1 Tax=Portunus trituberculatus TaxID=210409 RepID=A0A5B7G2W9_PORTR|nr:hypothetical protein [Portunus trituberculatus]
MRLTPRAVSASGLLGPRLNGHHDVQPQHARRLPREELRAEDQLSRPLLLRDTYILPYGGDCRATRPCNSDTKAQIAPYIPVWA